MKNNIMTIFRKELARFFLDKRLVFTILLLPGLMIAIMYNFMGSIISKEIGEIEAHRAGVYVSSLPPSVEEIFKGMNMELFPIGEGDVSKEMEKIKEKEAELLILFEEKFDEKVEGYEARSKKTAPQVKIYYNSSKQESSMAYNQVRSALANYEEMLNNKFDVNKEGEDLYNLATKEDLGGKVFGGMLPMLLMIFMWSGCLSVAPESIAGEKERGTIATLLITPTRRRDLALGKILALGFIAFLSGASSFIGTFTSLPALTKGMESAVETTSYSVADYGMLFLVIVSTVLIMVALISVISGFAKSVKEAATMASPVMVLIMIISFLPGILSSNEAKEPLYMFLLPLYNSILCMNGIFKFNYEISWILITVAVNLVTVVGLTALLGKLFQSEKVMFGK